LSTSSWLRRCGGSSAPGLRLICLPYAGAGASIYNGWRPRAGIEADIWSVQLPGRETRWREPPIRRLDDLVAVLAAELRVLLDVPFAFFGHSLGALLAFELTRALRRSGAPQPVRLLVSAHRAPHLPPWRPVVSTLPIPALLDRLAEMTGPSRTVPTDPELLAILAPTMRADFEVCETYRYVPEQPLDTPLSCFGAVDDPEVRMDEIEAWRRHTAGDCRIHPFTGGHLFVRDRTDDVLADLWSDLCRLTPTEPAW
jgi:medium-chain acyl-[acyl-carrier-protein] hydrolase